MADTPKATLVEGPIVDAMLRLAVPMGLGIIAILAVNLIDTYFVGQLGTDALGAMSFTFPIVGLVFSIAMGLGIGTMSALSRAIGAGDGDAAQRLTTHALILSVSVVTVVALLGLATQEMVFRLLGASEEVIPLLTEYMTIWYLGSGLLVIPMVGNSVMRSLGDARTPAVVMFVAAVANAIFDPLLIFGFGPIPALGLRGAAIATVLARAVTLLAMLYVLVVREQLVRLAVPDMSTFVASARQILSVGAPAMLTNVLTPIATAVMTAVIAGYGTEAVAAFGVGSRIEGLAMIAPIALSASLTPIVGQNWGAHHPERAGRAIVIANRFSLAWGLGAWLVLGLLGSIIGGAFTDDPEVLRLVSLFLWIVPVSWGAGGAVNVVSAAFNAVDHARRATLLSVTRSLLLAVPLAIGGGMVAGVQGAFAGIATATLVTAVVAAWWVRELTVVGSAEVDGVPTHAATLEGASREVAEALEGVIQRIAHLDGVKAKVKDDALAFVVGRCEIGHVHPGGEVDMPLPGPVRQHLVKKGLVEPHRDGGHRVWVSMKLTSVEDCEQAGWLLRLVHAVLRLRRHGPDDAQAKAEMDALDMPAGLRACLEQSVGGYEERVTMPVPVAYN